MIDVKMWGRALEQMPKLSQSEWQTLDPVAKWLIACRASVLFMTFTAAALGGLMAWRAGVFHWDLWLATVLGLMFAHATNNLLNDYTDSKPRHRQGQLLPQPVRGSRAGRRPDE